MGVWKKKKAKSWLSAGQEEKVMKKPEFRVEAKLHKNFADAFKIKKKSMVAKKRTYITLLSKKKIYVKKLMDVSLL